jgi:hypothetical protein
MWDQDRKLIEDNSIVSEFKVKSDSARDLKAVVTMCFKSPKTIFKYFKKDGPKLMLYTYEQSAKNDGAALLPFPLTEDNAYDFIYAWLHSFKKDERTWEYQGGDGSHVIGFTAEWFDCGKPFNVEFEAINIYYSK